ncbi:hypothetical protein Taro_048058 [Colocasia esculenta]|uniref:Gag protein n=1 Tax=Colocasia esculenta TaxID=4460 RepID=A0A843X638_COLES|nr:hypothetical protein [Colocasia esculenta]
MLGEFHTEPVTREAHPYPHRISGMADRRDWGGGGDDPEESTQRMIERIWESLTDIRARMDQQASVPPVVVPPGDVEVVPVAPVPPRVEVPFAAPVPPPMSIAEEPVLQVEKFLRLQPPTYSGGPNPDTAEHWVHEIERVFATMRCPAADRVVLAAYQLRGFALELWRLKMQTTFAGRTEEAITWPEFLDVFNDTFFPVQVQQVKREQFRILQQVVPRGMPQALVFRHTHRLPPWPGAASPATLATAATGSRAAELERLGPGTAMHAPPSTPTATPSLSSSRSPRLHPATAMHAPEGEAAGLGAAQEGYIVLYVEDVAKFVEFYANAFG